jgi:hypothetical protein
MYLDLWGCDLCYQFLFLDNIFARFDNEVFRQTVGIPMGMKCVPLNSNFLVFVKQIYSTELNYVEYG